MLHLADHLVSKTYLLIKTKCRLSDCSGNPFWAFARKDWSVKRDPAGKALIHYKNIYWSLNFNAKAQIKSTRIGRNYTGTRIASGATGKVGRIAKIITTGFYTISFILVA